MGFFSFLLLWSIGTSVSVIAGVLLRDKEDALVLSFFFFLFFSSFFSFKFQHTTLHLKDNLKYSFGSGMILEMLPYF